MENNNLVTQLFEYLNSAKNEKLEIKPNEFENLDSSNDENTFNSKLEQIKKNSGTLVSKENKVICDNIIKTFLGLNDEKFLACMIRIKDWGFDTCIKEFITNYYLYIKNDNKLRFYIINHLDHLISILKNEVEKNLTKHINLFNFENTKDAYEIQLLRNELKNKLNVAMGVSTPTFNEDSPIGQQEITRLNTQDEKNNLRIEITNNLRRENPDLEEIL